MYHFNKFTLPKKYTKIPLLKKKKVKNIFCYPLLKIFHMSKNNIHEAHDISSQEQFQ